MTQWGEGALGVGGKLEEFTKTKQLPSSMAVKEETVEEGA